MKFAACYGGTVATPTGSVKIARLRNPGSASFVDSKRGDSSCVASIAILRRALYALDGIESDIMSKRSY